MRDLTLQLLARLHRLRRPIEAQPEIDPMPDPLECQVQEAFPRPVVSEALRARVAHICRESMEAAPSGRRPAAWNRRSWMRIARWGSLALAAATLAAIWMSNRPGAEALAATVRAMESVPVIHVVSRGDKGGHGEIWIVDGVGLSLHSFGRDMETIIVDDLVNQFRSIIPKRPDTGISEPRVEITPSQLADPKQKAAIWDAYTKAGMLKELQSHQDRGQGQVQMVWVKEGGRRLLRIHVPGPGRGTTFYSDAVTGRIQRIEDEGPNVRSDPELIQYVLDYPPLARVDRALFRFTVPAGVVVWDRTDGPSRWARGDEATCLDRMKALREALRHYANEHGGRWPEALRPALDVYAATPEVFRCPLATRDTGFEYHRPGELLAKQALATWNRRKTDPLAQPDWRLMGARPAVLECRHAGGPVFSLYADGNLYRWSPKPTATVPAAATAPTPPSPLDPRAAAVLAALAEGARRLSEVKVTYDYRATHLVPWELPPFGPGSQRPTKQGPGDFGRARILWARKGAKMLYDSQSRLPGGPGRQRWITDGETVLLQSASGPDQPLSPPNAQPSRTSELQGAHDVGLDFPGGPLADLLAGKREVRFRGRQPVGGDGCVLLEVSYPEQSASPVRLWFDPGHGYLLRRAEQYKNGRLWTRMVTTAPREWAPGVYLATHIDQTGYLQDGRPTVPTHRWTAVVRGVTVGGLPDSLFQPVPVGSATRPGTAVRK